MTEKTECDGEKRIQSEVPRMSRADKIFYQRLERIRAELDAYISTRFFGGDVNAVSLFEASHPDTVREKQQKEKGSFSCQSPRMLQSPRESKTTAGVSAGSLKAPEFLRKAEHEDINKVLDQKEESFSTRLLRLIDEKGLKDSAVYKSANIDRRLFSRIRSNEDYMPSKKTAISLCLALQLEMDETKKLLGTAGYTLSASSRFDLIIMYLIENNEYNIHFANMVLDDYGEGTLSR